LLSEAQMEAAKDLLEINLNVLGLTGTMTSWTERTLAEELDLSVVATYSIDKAIEEGVIVDYEITVVRVPLDDKRKNNYKGKVRTEKQQFDAYGWVFASGKGNHMAVVKIGNTGVTYKPLNRVIINYFDSNAENLAQKINRCMAMEYNNPDKRAQIYIVCSNEDVEAKWLQKALEFFDKNKIKFV
jgi:superfamily II DNA or RNA helicase